LEQPTRFLGVTGAEQSAAPAPVNGLCGIEGSIREISFDQGECSTAQGDLLHDMMSRV
jgi:hypothetical protein